MKKSGDSGDRNGLISEIFLKKTINEDKETTLMSINGWMDKENVVHINNGILFSHR